MMMMKAAKLGWAGPGAGQEQGRNRAGAELSREGRTGQNRAERGELGRNWGGARNVLDRSRAEVQQGQGRSGSRGGVE